MNEFEVSYYLDTSALLPSHSLPKDFYGCSVCSVHGIDPELNF